MKRIRGFSLLEIMLALIVVGIGISVVLTFSSSSRQQTNGVASANDYSVITNDILEQFIKKDIKTCNDDTTTGCPTIFKQQFSSSAAAISAYDYLCGNTSSSYRSPSPTACKSSPTESCTNGKISDDQYIALCNSGLDLLAVKIELASSSSDAA